MKTIASILIAALLFSFCPLARAGVASEAVEKTSEYILQKFGKEVTQELGEEGAKLLTRRLTVLAAKFGEEEALAAAQKIGPRVFRLLEEAGADAAPQAVRLMARMGEDSLWIVARKQSLALFGKYGDEAAMAMLKHKEIAESLIEQLGPAAARALNKIDGQGARRLAMLAEDGTLANIPQKKELLETISKYGDGAMNWVWRNKGALATAAVVTAFVADPKPFIDGTVQVAQIGTEHIVKPVASQLAGSIAQRTQWTIVLIAIVAAFVLLRILKARRKTIAAAH